jgi:serine/threonine-protein kinase
MLDRVLGGKYKLERLLGAGGAGTVFQAREQGSPQMVAVKVLHADRAFDEEYVRRFHREALAAKNLAHEGIVRMLDFGQEPDGTLFLVMEYVPGRSLRQVLDQEGPQPFVRVVNLVSQVCDALGAAHDKGIVHRDVTPANILLVEGFDAHGEEVERVKICDFGVARLRPAMIAEESATGRQGGIVGTPEYMSPEQIQGGALDGRSDVYACGILMYEMITNKLPLDAPSPVTIMLAHLNEEPPSPRRNVANIDRGLELLILRCLRKDPGDRPQTAAALRAALVALRS